MAVQAPIADMLTRIRNAQMSFKASVTMPSSKIKAAIANVLTEEGYVEGFDVVDLPGNKKEITIGLKYFDGKPVIESLQCISKPSLRAYCSVGDLPKVKGGLGVAIISTSQGMMSDRMARTKNLGGEVICTVE